MKKEKTPEKKLVDEIWEEIILVLAETGEKVELNRIVETAWKNGASCDEIQRVFEENLPRYKRKPDDEIERLRALATEPFTPEEKKKILKWVAIGVAALAAIIVLAVISRPEAFGSRFEETSVDGISFNIPNPFLLADTGENLTYYYKEFQYEDEIEEDKYYTYSLDIYVFKDLTVDQALSYFEFDSGWKINRDITYGDYSGVRVDIIVMPLRNKVPQWFIFEKDGKAVAIFTDEEWIFKKWMEAIIN